MRVLFITPNLVAGGAERVWSILLPGLQRRGYDTRLIALDGGGPFADVLRQRDIPLEIVDMRHQADMGSLMRSRILREFVPDVVVSHGVSGLYVGRAVAQWRHARFIFNDHQQVGFSRGWRRDAMVRLMSRWVDLVVVVTGDQTGAWIERGYPRDRVAVVSNGVETPMVPESKATIRRDLKISDDAIVAALVARLRPEKRVADFVDAVRRVRESDDQVIALIVGDGPDRAAIERAGDGDSAIRLLGHRDDVPRVLKAADLLVLSSEYEAAPMVILEAMATGLPVIATNVGAVREMVEDGETGMLVPPMAPGQIAAKLAHLAGDVRLRDAMGAAGMQRQRERWDAEAMIDGYAKIIGRYDRAIRTPASVGLGPPPRADR